MSRYLLTTMPATGHVVPMLAIARELSARGHDIHWYTGAVYREQIEATGAVHHPIRSAEDFGGQAIGEAFPELLGLTGITMVRRAFQRIFIDNADGMLRDCQAILADHPADAILSEPLFIAARWLHELGGPPWADLGETMLCNYSRDTAPFGPGLFPLRGPVGQVRNRAMNTLHRRVVFAPVTAHYERARERVGLPPLGQGFIDTLLGRYLYMQATVPSFEYPRRDLPAHVHYIGPLVVGPAPSFQPPPWWSQVTDGRRVVLVTQGTVATDPRHLLAPTIQALAGEDLLVIATSGGPTEPVIEALDGATPANARIERFVPYAELMPHVDVLVTNGGYGTVQLALSHGVPIVVAGATEDKPENAARVAWSGTGIRIRDQSPAPERLREAVTTLLDDPSYAERAAAISAEMRQYDAPRLCADLLEQLAAAGAPVTRDRLPVAPRTPVALSGLGTTLIVGLLAAFALNLTLRWLGETFLDVPKDMEALGLMLLLPTTILPVVGNCFGCYMSWRRPSPRSLNTFLAVAVVMTFVGIAISVSVLPSGAAAGSVATMLAVSIAPTLVIVPALLRLVGEHRATLV